MPKVKPISEWSTKRIKFVLLVWRERLAVITENYQDNRTEIVELSKYILKLQNELDDRASNNK